MGLLVAGFGCYLLLTRRRWTGLAFVVGGLAATWVATHLLIPAFGGSASFYWAYDQFGSSLGSALIDVITHPLHALQVFVTPWVKARTMIGLLAIFGFLPLASPMVVAVLPLLAERMLASGYPLWWQAKFQYDAFVVMMLCCAAVDGAARLQRRTGRPAGTRGSPIAGAVPPGCGTAARPGAPPRSGPPRFAPPPWCTSRPRRSARCCTPASTGSMRGCGRPRRPSRTCPPGSRWRRPTTSARGCPAGTRCCCSTGRPGGRRGWSGTPSGSTSRSARPASRPRRWPTCGRTGTRRCSPTTVTWCCTAQPTAHRAGPGPPAARGPPAHEHLLLMAASRVLSLRAVNRALLARQLLLDRPPLPDSGPDRAAQVVQTIEHLVGLQAQAPFPPYYGLHSRLDGFRPADLAALITDRSVVRIALMRGTIHLVSARDCLPLRRLVQPVIERGMRGAFGRQLAGVDTEDAGRGGPEPGGGRADDVQPARPGAGGALARSPARCLGPGGARVRAAGAGAAPRRLGPGRAVAAHVGRTLARPAGPARRAGSSGPGRPPVPSSRSW